MIDEEALANTCSGVNLDPGGKATKLGEQATEKAKLVPPQEMGHTMQPQGMETWIAGDDLPGVSCRWVFSENSPNVLS